MQRDYSSRDKAAALAALEANNGNLRRTARALKVPSSTLYRWKKDQINPEVSRLRTQEKTNLADAIESVVWEIVGAMPTKIEKAGLKDAAIAVGTGIDKFRLLREQPTSITGSADDRQSFLKSELRRLRAVHATGDDAYAASVRQLQSLFTDTTDPAYDPLLDYTKHPENWPVDVSVTVASEPTDSNN